MQPKISNDLKISKVILLVAVFAITIMTYYSELNEAWMIKFTILGMSACAAAVYILIFRSSVELSKCYCPLILALIWYIIRGLFNNNMYTELSAISYVSVPYIILFLSHNIQLTQREKDIIVTAIFYIIHVVFLISLIHYVPIIDFFTDLYRYSEIRDFSLRSDEFSVFFHNRNLYAISLVSFFPAGYFLFNKMQRRIFIVSTFIVLYITECRNAYIAAGIFLIFQFFFSQKLRDVYVKMKKIRSICIIVILLISIFFVTGSKDQLSSYFQNSHRVKLWKAALRVCLDNVWFGTGVGAFSQTFLSYQQEINKEELKGSELHTDKSLSLSIYVHNDMLETFGSGGIIILLIHGSVLWCIKKQYIKNTNTQLAISGMGVCILLSLFGYVSHIPISISLYFWYMSLLINTKTVKMSSIKYIAIILICMSFIIITFYQTSNIIYLYAEQYFEQQYFDEAEKMCRYIRKINPKHSFSYIMSGDIAFLDREYDHALDLYNTALQCAPGMLMIHYKIGKVYQMKKNVEKALEHYHIAEQRVSSSMKKDLWLRICQIYTYLKNWNHAKEYFDKVKYRFSDELDPVMYKDYISYIKKVYTSPK